MKNNKKTIIFEKAQGNPEDASCPICGKISPLYWSSNVKPRILLTNCSKHGLIQLSKYTDNIINNIWYRR